MTNTNNLLNTFIHSPEQAAGVDHDNVEGTINHLLRLGADPEKTVLGVPFYGRFVNKLSSESNYSRLQT